MKSTTSRRVALGTLPFLLVFSAATGGWAQAPVGPRPAPAAGRKAPTPLERLQQRVAALRSVLAELPSVKAQVKDVQQRLVELRQAVERLARSASSGGEVITRVDGLAERVKSLEQQVERLSGAVHPPPGPAPSLSPTQVTKGLGVGYDDGFYLSVAQDRFRLRIGGVFRTTFWIGEPSTEHDSLRPETKLGSIGFGVPNARFKIDGHLYTPKLSYYLEIEIGGSFDTVLRNVELTYAPVSWFDVTVGLLCPAFSRQSLIAPFGGMFVFDAVATASFAPGRDVGARIRFFQWKRRIFQELAVYNGAGTNLLGNVNTDLMYMAKVGISPLGTVPEVEGDYRAGARPPRFSVTAAYFFLPMPSGRDLDQQDGTDNLFVHQAALQVAAVWRGLSLDAELYYRHEDHGAAVTQLPQPEKRRRHRLGGYAQLGYFVRPIRLQVSARYSYLEPVSYWDPRANALVHRWTSPIPGTPAGQLPDRVHEATLGVGYFPYVKHLRIVANYSFLLEKGYHDGLGFPIGDRQVHLFALLTQLNF